MDVTQKTSQRVATRVRLGAGGHPCRNSKQISRALLTSWLLCLVFSRSAGQSLPVLQSRTYTISIRDGADFRQNRWNIDPKVNPDVYQAPVARGARYKLVSFITDVDSLGFRVERGRKYPFVIVVNGKDSAFTQIEAVPAAVTFTPAYIRAHQGKTLVEIPPVYELVNIVIALTKAAQRQPGLVVTTTPYYQAVQRWFGPYATEPIVQKIDSVLAGGYAGYFSVKMNAYAFGVDARGRIRPGGVYERLTGVNTLTPFLADLQRFADKSRFGLFFRQHRAFYSALIRCYRDSLGVAAMQQWLGRQFPQTTYNAYKIVFSPLVGNNQSANWFEDNGFKEVQAHVNFPYRRAEEAGEFSPAALRVKDGNIVFTELNHGFIGPQGQALAYQQAISEAFADLSTWIWAGSPAEMAYHDARACFDEYMNWALVSLRYIEEAPPGEQANLIARMEQHQVAVRGFKKFAEFDRFLDQLYQHRQPGQTLADLYPQIVAWFVANK